MEIERRVELWPLERFIEYARNPRRNDHAVEKMAAAIYVRVAPQAVARLTLPAFTPHHGQARILATHAETGQPFHTDT